MLVPTALRPNHAEARRDYMDDPESRQMGRKFYAQRKDGSCIPVEIGLTPFRAFGFTGALATVTNISEREEIERREIIASEVRHRARNILTIVQALARRTLPLHQRAPFMGMLQTIARTQEVLSAQTTVPLRAIIGDELGGFGHEVADAGCELSLSPRAALDFALIIHELTTNALKYGALSRSEGRIEIVCRREMDGRSFSFVWQERGGPRVAPPTRRGFGSTILQDLARGFASRVEFDYAPDGFRYELRAELARICEAAEVAQPALAQ
jgi:two-component sensor histidine kinase